MKWTRFDWWTEYSDKNASHVDALWDAILPSHGFVAMDTSWAIAHQWPESMRLPSDATKSVYLLEAYHQLHCIVGLSRLFQSTESALTVSSGRESFGRPSGKSLGENPLHIPFPTPVIALI